MGSFMMFRLHCTDHAATGDPAAVLLVAEHRTLVVTVRHVHQHLVIIIMMIMMMLMMIITSTTEDCLSSPLSWAITRTLYLLVRSKSRGLATVMKPCSRGRMMKGDENSKSR